MEVYNLCEQDSLVSQFVSELRDTNIQKDRMRFRTNVKRLGQIAAYELSKQLHYASTETQTPLAIARTRTLDDPIVLATVLRAGLPFHEGFLSYFDNAENAFISAYRKPHYHDNGFDVVIEYMASPSLEGKTLVIVDPMLATGYSMSLAYRALLTKGTPARIHIVSIIATDDAIGHIGEYFPQDITTVWTCDLDHELNEHSYIVPGLGDAGDLLYGTK